MADSWDVAPSEAKLRLVTERVIEVATGVGVGVGVVGVVGESPPPQLAKNSENNRALNATAFFMPSFCPAPLRPATQDEQNCAYGFSGGLGEKRGVPPTGVAPVGKMDPPELPEFFRGTVLQWRRCVRSCTSTAPPATNEGGCSGPAIDPDFDPQVSTVVSTASTKVPNGNSPTSVLTLFGMGARK